MPIDVTLTDIEMKMASLAGLQRHLDAMAQHMKDHEYKYTGVQALANHIIAACAEMAFAKGMGRYFGGTVGTFKAPDVGEYGVRHTEYLDGCLIVRSSDVSERYYVLVRGSLPLLTIVGYMKGSAAKSHPEWLCNPHCKDEAWFVPQSELTPLFPKPY
jgi:hypothetical protein